MISAGVFKCAAEVDGQKCCRARSKAYLVETTETSDVVWQTVKKAIHAAIEMELRANLAMA